MNKTSREFLTKLAELMADYKVGIEIIENRSGWETGVEYEIPYVTDEGYPLDDYVLLGGYCHNSSDIFDLLQKDIKNDE